ncbi:MAG: glycosyltransferase [Candidatus Humimicrobiaceae bacterium]
MPESIKIAIVHDYLIQYGGAEKVIEALNETFPQSPIYTSIYSEEDMPDKFKSMNIFTTYMQKFPMAKKLFKYYLFFYPRAFRNLDLKEYDLILSSCSSFSKGIIKREGACHICYCYTPMRFVWNYDNYISKENFNKLILKFLPFFLKRLKRWDLNSNNNVDYFVSISEVVKNRIKKYYNRYSDVIYPPVEISKFINLKEEKGDYFLIVSRLNAYKNIDIVIDVFNNLDLKLKIVGDGSNRKFLEKRASGNKNIEFLGKLSETDLIKTYTRCRAYIFSGEEDFGISPLEAQAAGKPVIAYAAGGALETIKDGETGVFFYMNSPDSLREAVKKFLEIENNFDIKKIKNNALRFSKDIFKEKISKFILEKYYEFKSKN